MPSKATKNSRICESRGTFTAHGFEGAAKPFVQVFNIRRCLPSQFRLCRWESPSSALIDFSDRAWANFRSLESCRAEASGRFATPILLGRSSRLWFSDWGARDSCRRSQRQERNCTPSSLWHSILHRLGRGNVYIKGGEGITLLISDGSLRQVADGIAFPNGMAITPDIRP